MVRPQHIGAVLLAAVIFSMALTVATGPALAQEDNTTSEAEEQVENKTETVVENKTDQGDRGCTEHIDDVTSICTYHYDSDAGEIVMTLYSERPQRVTLTDAGAFMTGGEVNRARHTLKGRSKVRFAVTEYEGFVGLSVDTGRTLYAVPVETGTALSAPKESDFLALLAGLVVVPIGAVGIYRLREEMRDDGVLRIDG